MNPPKMPNAQDAERAVIGSLLLEPEIWPNISQILTPEDFYNLQNAEIYRAICRLAERNAPIDYISVIAELSYQGRLGDAGGDAYVAALANSVPTALHAAEYARVVARMSLARQLVRAGTQIAEIGYAAPPPDEAIVKANVVMAGVNTRQSSRFRSADDIGAEMETRICAQFENPQRVWGLATGLQDLDMVLGGLEGKALIVVGGAPGMGKSALGLQIAGNVAASGKRVAYFTLEMSEQEQLLRLVCQRYGYNSRDIRRGMKEDPPGVFRRWTEAERAAFLADLKRVRALPIHFNDAAAITTTEACAAATELARTQGVALVVFDYLQLAKSDGHNRTEQVGQIAHGLKEMAKTLNVPVLALAQISRAPATAEDKRPQLWHLRESGDIEANADVVILLYRAPYYYTPEQWRAKYKNEPYPDKVAEIIIAKNRTGPTGYIEMVWDGPHTRFLPLAKTQ